MSSRPVVGSVRRGNILLEITERGSVHRLQFVRMFVDRKYTLSSLAGGLMCFKKWPPFCWHLVNEANTVQRMRELACEFVLSPYIILVEGLQLLEHKRYDMFHSSHLKTNRARRAENYGYKSVYVARMRELRPVLHRVAANCRHRANRAKRNVL
jgi:hypothetical protein